MSLRNAVERLALRDAHDFEVRVLAMQRQVLAHCQDAETRRVIEQIIAEEEEHLRQFNALLPAAHDEPDLSSVRLKGGAPCEMLREILEKERASVTFYDLLGQRTPVPSLKAIFRRLADSEKGHLERMEQAVRKVCGERP